MHSEEGRGHGARGNLKGLNDEVPYEHGKNDGHDNRFNIFSEAVEARTLRLGFGLLAGYLLRLFRLIAPSTHGGILA